MLTRKRRPKKKDLITHFTYNLLGDRYTFSGQAHIVAAAKAAYHRVYGDLDPTK